MSHCGNDLKCNIFPLRLCFPFWNFKVESAMQVGKDLTKHVHRLFLLTSPQSSTHPKKHTVRRRAGWDPKSEDLDPGQPDAETAVLLGTLSGVPSHSWGLSQALAASSDPARGQAVRGRAGSPGRWGRTLASTHTRRDHCEPRAAARKVPTSWNGDWMRWAQGVGSGLLPQAVPAGMI